MSWPRTLAPVVGALCLTLAPDARGDDASEQLVQACYSAVNAGKLELACKICEEAVAEANKAQGKVAALMNLARCQEARGQLVRGLDRYREARAQMDPDDARAATVDERITALALRIAHAQLDWSEAPEGCELRLDGALVEGRPAELALDPGEHVLEVRSRGYATRRETVRLGESASASFDVRPGARSSAPTPSAADADDSQRTAAYIVGAVGLAGIVGFVVTGGLFLDRQATVDELCPEAPDGLRRCEDPRGFDAADEGRALGVANAVLLGVGLAGVATGLILYFTAPPSPTGPMLGLDVSPSGATLSLGGRF